MNNYPRHTFCPITLNGIVKIDLGGGNVITADITNSSIQQLGLEEGVEAVAIIKATSVMVGVDE